MSKVLVILAALVVIVAVGDIFLFLNLQKSRVKEASATKETVPSKIDCEYRGKHYQDMEGFYVDVGGTCSYCYCSAGTINCQKGCPNQP